MKRWKVSAAAMTCSALMSTALVAGPACAADNRLTTPLGEVVVEVPDSAWTQDYGCQDVLSHFDVMGASSWTEWEASASVDTTGPAQTATSHLGWLGRLSVCPTASSAHRVRFDVDIVNKQTGMKVEAWVETTFAMQKMGSTTEVLFANRYKKVVAVAVTNAAGDHPRAGVVRLQRKKGSSWRTVASKTMPSDSMVSFVSMTNVKLAKGARYRATYSGNVVTERSSSASVRVR